MKQCLQCRHTYKQEESFCSRDGSRLVEIASIFPNAVIKGRYRVISTLGKGAMGTVYLVEHVIYHEQMAMKVCAVEDPQFRERFLNEARIMRKLQAKPEAAQNIVRVEDVDQTDEGFLYVVMEYVPGDALSRVISREGNQPGQPLDMWRALSIARQVCNALEVAHGNNPPIVHRDIKPENIMLVAENGNEVAKVLDFGIAKIVKGASETFASRTGEGVYLGSPSYSSPEQAAGKTSVSIDGRSDIYSLGVVLYEMLTGQVPFTAETYAELLTQHITTPPRSPKGLREDLPDALVALTMKALAKNPGARFQTAAEMRSSLDEVLAALPQPAPPKTEYSFNFVVVGGDIQYPVLIAEQQTLNDVLGHVLSDLNDRGHQLRSYSGGLVDALWQGRELNQMSTLRRQGVSPGDIVVIQSPRVRAEGEILKWLEKVEGAEAMLEVTPAELEAFRRQYQTVLETNPEILPRVETVERYCWDIRSILETELKKGLVAAFFHAANLQRKDGAFKAGSILKSRLRERLANQLSELIERYQLEDASRLLSQIKETDPHSSEFATYDSRLQSLLNEAERNLGKMVDLAASGDLERSRAILLNLRQRSNQLSSGFSVTRALHDVDTLEEWTRRVLDLVSHREWREAITALDERSMMFSLWPPFRHFISQLEWLDRVEQRLTGSLIQMGPRTESFFYDLLEVDLFWGSVNFESGAPNSMVAVGKEILMATGRLLREVEDQRAGFEEAALQQAFLNGIQNLAQRDPADARRRLKQAVAGDPTPQLKQLETELSSV